MIPGMRNLPVVLCLMLLAAPVVATRVGAMIVGGGVNVPLSERLTFFADARMMFGAEGNEGVVAVVPVRTGVAWRF